MKVTFKSWATGEIETIEAVQIQPTYNGIIAYTSKENDEFYHILLSDLITIEP